MAEPAVHPFLNLPPTLRKRWIVAFCNGVPSPPLGSTVPFPLLPPGETTLTWLEDQYRRAEFTGAHPDHLRESVVELVRLGLGDFEFRDKWNTLGLLVDLASACGFTDIEPKLRDWISGDYYSDVAYKVDGRSIPLHQTLWSTLIAWGCREDVVPYLKRDLHRPHLECGALCFSALGRLSPADAIAEIPNTRGWPLPYWREVLRSFLENFSGAAHALLQSSFLLAWRSCLGELFWDPATSESFSARVEEFLRILREGGLELSDRGNHIYSLKALERPWVTLEIDLSPFYRKENEGLMAYYGALIEGASSSLEGAQAFAL